MKKTIAILADYPVKKANHHQAVWLTELHRELEKREQYDIHWVILSKKHAKYEEYIARKQHFHVLPCGSRTLAQFLHYLPDRWKIANLLNKIRPDLLHAWGAEGCYGLCATDFPGKKLFSLQGALTAYAQRAEMGAFMKRQAHFEKKILRAVPFITTESEWARDRVHELAPNAHVRLWEYATESRFFAAERKISDSPCCLLASTNSNIKNIPLAIKAFSSPELRHVTLYLAGVPADAYPDLPDNIIPLGFVNRDKVVELLQKCWAFIHPSFADTGPTAIKEARTVGIPCVVSAECGAKQYIIHEKSGYIISPHDVQALKNAVLQLTSHKDISLQMGAYDRERCRLALSSQTMIDNLCRIYEEILEQK